MAVLLANRSVFCLRFRSGNCRAGASCKFSHETARLRSRSPRREALCAVKRAELELRTAVEAAAAAGDDSQAACAKLLADQTRELASLFAQKEEGEVSEPEEEHSPMVLDWEWVEDPEASAAERRPVGRLQEAKR